jgi:alkanesulfonate monooxygenase SsuD/methylene tetrahydromethanopterin reductase-like flavin-dependent oxidoreductase (luciferase family)
VSVLEGHCADLGRDPAEITKTKLATLVIADTHEAAEKKVAPLREAMGERFDAIILYGDRDGVGEQIVANLDAGLDGIIVNIPEVGDLEAVATAGEVLAAATKG